MEWSQKKYKTPEFWQATIYIMLFYFVLYLHCHFM